ncbi:hypothetical protein O181_044837 [Austropuccinia psidii MF-1]|uniref:Uncharacterized protein n=1 Tax=Austropuccinia psidii MF-1 TaxID=1389203 RepID=A0A9Q3HI58_9BASI|nr:hypothetical protein [Austropuccinia psidii MF-1]
MLHLQFLTLAVLSLALIQLATAIPITVTSSSSSLFSAASSTRDGVTSKACQKTVNGVTLSCDEDETDLKKPIVEVVERSSIPRLPFN